MRLRRYRVPRVELPRIDPVPIWFLRDFDSLLVDPPAGFDLDHFIRINDKLYQEVESAHPARYAASDVPTFTTAVDLTETHPESGEVSVFPMFGFPRGPDLPSLGPSPLAGLFGLMPHYAMPMLREPMTHINIESFQEAMLRSRMPAHEEAMWEGALTYREYRETYHRFFEHPGGEDPHPKYRACSDGETYNIGFCDARTGYARHNSENGRPTMVPAIQRVLVEAVTSHMEPYTTHDEQAKDS